MSERLRAHLLINLSCLFWAGNIVVGRGARHFIDPWTLVSLRALLSCLLFLLLLRLFGRRNEPALREDWHLLLLMAMTGVAGYQAVFYFGLRYTDAINTALIHAISPLVTLFLARLVLASRIGVAPAIGGLVSMLGVAVILSRGQWQGVADLHFNTGDLLMLGAVLLWAIYCVAGQVVLRRRSLLSVTTIITLMSTAMVLPAGASAYSQHPPEFSAAVVGIILYVTLFAGVAALLCWNYGVKILGSGEAMAFMNMTPVYTAVAAALFLGEPATAVQMVGGLVVVSGCLYAVWGPGQAVSQAVISAAPDAVSSSSRAPT